MAKKKLTTHGRHTVRHYAEKGAAKLAESQGFHGADEALHFYHEYKHVKHAKGAFSEFRAAPSVQTAWEFGGKLVGVVGTDRVVGGLAKFATKLAIKSKIKDADAGNEMVQLMKSRVPVDTGRLLNGIQMEQDDDGEITITASAARDGDADYARFVEFGTHGGTVADDTFFADGANAGAALHPSSSSSGGGSPAQPYFWNSVNEVADKREVALDSAIGEAAHEEGF